MPHTMIEYAKHYLNAGLSVLPAKRAAKRPAVGAWKTYQTRRPTPAEVNAWFTNAHDGLCIVAGAVSGNLEMIDFDNGGELYDAWKKQISIDLFNRLVIERSPSGGWHVVYRCQTVIDGSMKLAERKTGDKVQTLIETRGEGGLFLCAPTTGYELVQGDFCQIPTLDNDERQILLDAAYVLNEYIPDPLPTPTPADRGETTTLRPGDDYNKRGDVEQLLQKYGWRYVGANAINQHWCRPGKTAGKSASLRICDKVFHPFSTNCAPFEARVGYSPFYVYTLLEHHGNFSAAAAELAKQGYGEPAPDTSGVDISGIVSSGGDDGDDDAAPALVDPGLIPEEHFSVPGFINQLKDFCLQTAPYPNVVLAFCGAMALQSFLAGRKIKEPGGIRTNIYLLALASTGTGKDWPRKINANILNLTVWRNGFCHICYPVRRQFWNIEFTAPGVFQCMDHHFNPLG